MQAVLVSNCGIARKALITINRCHGEPRLQTKRDPALNEILIQVGRAFVEPLMEFHFQRFVSRKASRNSLVEPETYLFFVFWIFGLWLLLRDDRESEDTTAKGDETEHGGE